MPRTSRSMTCDVRRLRLAHLRAHLLAQDVDGLQLAVGLEVPIGPAVAGIEALHMGTDLVDRARGVAADDGAVGADAGSVAA